MYPWNGGRVPYFMAKGSLDKLNKDGKWNKINWWMSKFTGTNFSRCYDAQEQRIENYCVDIFQPLIRNLLKRWQSLFFYPNIFVWVYIHDSLCGIETEEGCVDSAQGRYKKRCWFKKCPSISLNRLLYSVIMLAAMPLSRSTLDGSSL